MRTGLVIADAGDGVVVDWTSLLTPQLLAVLGVIVLMLLVVALSLLDDEFGATHVREMPVNHPGFDIEVTLPSGMLHVEVKGTVLPAPVLHLSEGQRQHAELLGGRFRLVVVYRIDKHRREHEVARCSGTQLAAWGNLQAEAWSGVLIEPSS